MLWGRSLSMGGALGAFLGGEGVTDTGYDAFVSYSHAADDLLAPRLQAGLQRFAKPWWRRRALRIFRDESSLSASPHLWGSIVTAMEQSAWFVLLLSPDAASSPWVNREITWWTQNKDPSRIIPVLTDGTFTWADGDVAGNAAPAAMSGVFSEEPRWVDLRFARDDEQLDLKNPRFSGAVADIASTLRDIPKDELESEEVRQHRRTIRTVWAAVILVLVLAAAAAVGAVVATGQAREARDQRNEAHRQTEIAMANEELAVDAEQRASQDRDRADEQAEIALQNEAIARQAELVARAGELTAQSSIALEEDPELALLIVLEAVELIRKAEQPIPRDTIAALHAATQAARLMLRLEGGFGAAAVSADGELFATDSSGGTHGGDAVLLRDSDTGDIVSSLPGPGPVVALAFSPTAPLLAVGYGNLSGKPEIGTVRIYDTAAGEIVAELPAPPHVFGGSGVPDRPIAWSDDGRLLAASSFNEGSSAVTVWAKTSWEVVGRFTVVDGRHIAFVDAETIAVAEGSAQRVGFYNARSGALVDVLDTPDFVPGRLVRSPDGGELIMGSQASTRLEVWDLASRSSRWSRTHSTPIIQSVSPDSKLVAVTGFDAVVRLFDIDSGDEVLTLGGLTGAWGAAFHPDGRRLIGVGLDQTHVWDVSPAGPSALGGIGVGPGHPFHASLSPDGAMLALTTSGPLGGRDFGEFIIFDLKTFERVFELKGQSIGYWVPAVISPDWRYLAWVDGDLAAWVRNLSDATPDLLLPPCTAPKAFSPDSTALLLDALWLPTAEGCELPDGIEVTSQVLDLTTGETLLDLGPRLVLLRGGAFSPGGALQSGRYVTANIDGSVEIWDVESGWLLGSVCFDLDGELPSRGPGWAARLGPWLPHDDLTALQALDEVESCADFTFSAGAFDATGRYLPGGTVNGRAWILDLARLAEGQSLEKALIFNVAAFDGAVGGHAMGGDGLFATATLGRRPLRLWDIASGELTLELARSAEDFSLIVFTPDGQWLYHGDTSYDGYVIRRFPLDPDRLVELAESMVTRGFTDDECRRFPSAPSCDVGGSDG